MPRIFPTPAHDNIGFTLTGPSSHYSFCSIATDAVPDLHLLDTGQFFARWTWEPVNDESLDFGGNGDVLDGYRLVDNITDAALHSVP